MQLRVKISRRLLISIEPCFAPISICALLFCYDASQASSSISQAEAALFSAYVAVAEAEAAELMCLLC